MTVTDAWNVIAWWHRVKPEIQIDWFSVPGPLGPAGITACARPSLVPEHVQEARQSVGLPRIQRGEK